MSDSTAGDTPDGPPVPSDADMVADAEAARAEHAERLARLADPAVAAEVASWADAPDPMTDGIDHGDDEVPHLTADEWRYVIDAAGGPAV